MVVEIMSDDRRHFDEKRYAILSRDSIKLIAEAGGHAEISDDVAALLSEDVGYRLREATQNSCQFMRHARRKRLTTEDFNKALRNSDVEALFGYGSPEPIALRQTRDGDIFFNDDPEVNLAHFSINENPPTNPGKTTVEASWLAVEGNYRGTAVLQGASGKVNGKAPRSVSEELLVYYDKTTKAILGNDQELMKIALSEVRTNTKIAPLLPYFVNFISNGVKTVNHDITQLNKLLHTVKSLIQNQALYLEPEPYLNTLVQGVLYCVLEPLAAINSLNDHWVLRDYAARLLAQITRDWTTPVNSLDTKNIEALKSALYDPAKPFCTHYGAVMGLFALGRQAVEDVLLPHLPSYWPHLQTVMEDISYANAQVKADAHKVYGAIMLTAERLVLDQMCRVQEEASNGQVFPPPKAGRTPSSSTPNGKSAKEKNSTSSEKKSSETAETVSKQLPITPGGLFDPHAQMIEEIQKKTMTHIYHEFYSYFGDGLATRLPVIENTHDYTPKKEEIYVSLTDPETLKSGEALLEAFMETIEKSESEDLKSERSEKSDRTPDEMDVEELDEKSEKSDRSFRSDHSEETLTLFGDDVRSVDLAVKSTVDDPSGGIKLTITKRPKITIKPPEPPQHEKDKRGRKRKQSFRGSRLHDFFDYIPAKKPVLPKFSVQVEGIRQRLSSPRRKRFSIEGSEPSQTMDFSRYCAKLPLFGKKRYHSKQKTYSKFHSGNIGTLI